MNLAHFAARNMIDDVRRLLAEGASPEDCDQNGTSALVLAAAGKGGAPIVKLLLDHGAKVGSRTWSGSSALHETKDLEVARLLVAAGADVNARDDEGNTPLNGLGKIEADKVEFLLGAGADPNISDEIGDTPIMAAVQHQDLPRIELLVKHGANVHWQNVWEKSALDLGASTEIQGRLEDIAKTQAPPADPRPRRGTTIDAVAPRLEPWFGKPWLLLPDAMPGLRGHWVSKPEGGHVVVFDPRGVSAADRKANPHLFRRNRKDFVPFALVGTKKLHSKPGGFEVATVRATWAIFFLNLFAGVKERCPITLWHCPMKSAEDSVRIANDFGDFKVRPVDGRPYD